jgi:uncharacterized protein YceK
MKSAMVCVLLFVLNGCASVQKHPVDIECKGKASITGTGYAGTAISASDNFTLTADCGDSGFSFHSGPAATAQGK